MFDLIGSRSDHLLRLTAYISKHCDPFNSPTSVILIPAYLHGDIGTYLKESYLFVKEIFQIITYLGKIFIDN